MYRECLLVLISLPWLYFRLFFLNPCSHGSHPCFMRTMSDTPLLLPCLTLQKLLPKDSARHVCTVSLALNLKFPARCPLNILKEGIKRGAKWENRVLKSTTWWPKLKLNWTCWNESAETFSMSCFHQGICSLLVHLDHTMNKPNTACGAWSMLMCSTIDCNSFGMQKDVFKQLFYS